VSGLLALPITIPLLGAAVAVLVGRARLVQRAIALTSLSSVSAISVVLLVHVDRHGPLSLHAGGWPAPMGITLVADRLSTMLLTVASVVVLAVALFAIGQPGAERNHVGFQSVYLVLAAGVAASFLTADLFNLFVAFEMMLMASYVLITLGGRLDQVRAGMTYVVISLLASTLFLTALGLVYAATGTVDLADLAGRLELVGPGLRQGLAVLFLVVFGIKAGLFPLFFWLPDAYPTAPSPVTAVFAGLLTKVGVYAIFRTQTMLFPSAIPIGLVMVVAGLTMVVGVLGAIAQDDVRRILSFQIISHIGTMVMGLAFFTTAGLAGALFYLVHHIVAKTGLFLVAGLIEHVGGSSRLTRLGGLARSHPAIAVLFAVPALSLAGMPPFSGFVAKLALVDAGVAGRHYAIVAASLLASALTLYSLAKIWSGVFWSPITDFRSDGEPAVDSEADGSPLSGRTPRLMVAPAVAIVVASLAIAVAAAPLYRFCERAAADLLMVQPYLEAVQS
jgi:multicomponent Na+:H+ antiporter subunit D